MADSGQRAIVESAVAALLTVPGMESAKIVPLTRAFEFRERDDGSFVLDHHEMPDRLPGAVVAINEGGIERHTLNQSTDLQISYRVPLVIAIYASSDGNTLMSAHHIAWRLTEQSILVLGKTMPSGFPGGMQGMAHFEPGDFAPIEMDDTNHGMALHVFAVYAMRS